MSFQWKLRVYWEDTDAGGVVYYANYLKFMERSRTEWLRAQGVDQSALREKTGAVMVVKSINVDYIGSARLDDELEVRLTLAKLGGASLSLHQEIWRIDGPQLIAAEVRIACLDDSLWKPRRFPKAMAAAIVEEVETGPRSNF